ncbi:TVP38/TMEM64 family protein [Candidatus Pacearchaeota archaeon]|nr:TVP38/TMEM64 family protein [Candidatus Pacearchaeota archaeon]
MKKGHVISLVLVILLIILATYFIEKAFSFNIAKLENYIGSFGSWVPILLLVLIIITSSVGLIFTIPVAITALLLNSYIAFFISILGLTIGAAISFFVARYIGREYFENRFRKNVEKLKDYDKTLSHEEFLRVFFLRLITLIPYELINIGSGLSRIKFLPFILATLIGIMPGTIITIYFMKSTQNIFSIQFLFASILIMGFSLIPLFSRKIRKIVFNLD